MSLVRLNACLTPRVLQTATPPLSLPVLLGSGRAIRRTRRFGFQWLSTINAAEFSYKLMVSISQTAQRAAVQLPGATFHAAIWHPVRRSRHVNFYVVKFFKTSRQKIVETQQSKDYTDHRALDARGLVAQSINSELQKTTPTTEHSMLRDWSPSLLTQKFKDCTDHWALDARGLVVKLVRTVPTTEHSMPGDWSSNLLGLHRPPSPWCSGTGRLVY